VVQNFVLFGGKKRKCENANAIIIFFISSDRKMRHLAAHFVRHLPKGANIKKSNANKNTSLINVEPIHVVDPLVDLREYLRNGWRYLLI
jgi:hypothetical protein